MATNASKRAGSRCPITVAGWDVEGVSVAGQETCIILPQIKVALDIGRCPNKAVGQPLVFITHGHMDHIGGIPFHAATRALMGMKPTQLYSVPQVCSAAQRLMDIHSEVEDNPIPITISELLVGDEVKVRNDMVVRPFITHHVIPSQGYLVVGQKRKLKKEFQGASRDDIVAAKKQGIEINYLEEVPEVAFTGDTTIDFVRDPGNEDVLRAKLLIMECTFLDDGIDQEGAASRGHMHIRDIAEHADKFQNEAILLMHFSARFKPDYIEKQLDDLLPKCLRRRVIPFLEGFSLL